MRIAPALAAMVAALCSAQAAFAQASQLPPVPFYDWTGVYLGANLGYVSASIVTGGGGYVQFSSSGTTTDSTGAPVTTTGTSRRTAWVAGAGTESAVTPNVILRLEFLYLQLLDNTQNSASTTPATSSERVYNIIGRVGLSYKFGWGGY